MEIKKSESANLENKKLTWVLVGLIVVLAAHFVAFEWTQYEQESTGEIVDAGDIVLEEEIIPITMPEKKTATEQAADWFRNRLAKFGKGKSK